MKATRTKVSLRNKGKANANERAKKMTQESNDEHNSTF